MTRLNNYNRSTHDNSFVLRTTMAPGVLVPTMTELLLPGDTYPIQTRCHTLTHPTIGPLFGSFKQQNDFFFCPIRLYNAMLHNNALNIGLDMKKVKFPYMRTGDKNRDTKSYLPGSNNTILNQVNPSSLLGYLGWGSLQSSLNEGGWEEESWNMLKPIMYFDIFKNYYANKQEPKFYTIGVAGVMGYNNTKTDNGYYFVSCKLSGTGWTETNRSPRPNFNYTITDNGTYLFCIV
nr:MAG TPA: Major capsid protein [Microviridae sp.]